MCCVRFHAFLLLTCFPLSFTDVISTPSNFIANHFHMMQFGVQLCASLFLLIGCFMIPFRLLFGLMVFVGNLVDSHDPRSFDGDVELPRLQQT